jgi:choline-glycine betaine transporter
MARDPARIRALSGMFVVLLAVLAFGTLFYRMVGYMESITVSIGRMSDDVASMSREMQRVNPLRMMEGMSPGKN